MYRYVFLDLDDTILDFTAAEHAAYSETLRRLGLAPTVEVMALYRRINHAWWEKHERGEIDREALLVLRHEEFFRTLGVQRDAGECERIYRGLLGVGHWFIDGAQELLEYLSERGYELYIASNGVADTQYSRIESAGIGHYFRQIFISEDSGFHKPEKEYFDWCFARIPGFDPTKALFVGDSLTSDIRGAKNAGLASCWFNPKGKTAPPELTPDHEVRSLAELRELL